MPLKIGSYQLNFIPGDEKLFIFDELDTIHKFFFVFSCMWTVLWIASTICFIFRIKNLYIQVRSPILSLLGSCGSQISLIHITACNILGKTHTSCFSELWFYVVFFQLSFVPYCLKYARYYCSMYQIERWKKQIIKDPNASIWNTQLLWIAISSFITSVLSSIACYYQYSGAPEYITAYGCQIFHLVFSPLIVLIVVILILSIMLLILTKTVNDVYKLMPEFICSFVLFLVTIIPYIFIANANPDKFHDYDGFIYAYVCLSSIFNIAMPIRSSYLKPPERKGGLLNTTEEIIKDEDAYKILEEIVVQRDVEENLLFVKAVMEFREITDNEVLRTASQSIFNEFIKMGAPHWINISARTVENVRSRLEFPTSDLFNEPYHIVMGLLTNNFLPDVKMHPEYEKVVRQRENEADEKRRTQLLFSNNST